MPEAVTGYWKGFAVTKEEHIVVYAFLEANGAAVTGRYELEGVPSNLAKGDLTGSVSHDEITLTSSEGSGFHGRIAGEPPHGPFIHGLITMPAGGLTIGTLTLVRIRRETHPPVLYAVAL